MARHPTKPGGSPVTGAPRDDPDLDSGRYRSIARAALAKAEQVAQRLEDHMDQDNDQYGALSRDVEVVREEVRSVSGQVSTLNTHVGDLRVNMARTLSVVDSIKDAVAEQQQIKHVTMIAEVETGKVQKITTIEDAADQKKAHRAFLLKIALTIIAALGTALGMLIEHYR